MNSLRVWLPSSVSDLSTRLQSVRWRLTMILGIAAAVSLLLIGLSVILFVQMTEVEAWTGRQSEAARSAANTVATFINRADDNLQWMGTIGLDEFQAQPEIIHSLLQKNPALDELIVLNQRGKVIASAAAWPY